MDVKILQEGTQERNKGNAFNLFDKLTRLTQRRLVLEYQVNNINTYILKKGTLI